MRTSLALTLLILIGCDPAQPAQAREAAAAEAAAPKVARPSDEVLALADVVGEGAVASALRKTQDRLRATPDNPDLWIELGRRWIQKARGDADPGYYLHAEAAAAVALRKSPGNLAALNLRGLVLLNQHAFAAARDLAREILARDDDDPAALGTLSDALLEIGDIDAAEAAAQRMMDRKPDLPSYSRASYFRWLRGDPKGAAEALRLAFDAGRGSPDNEPTAWVLTQAALIFWHEGDLEGALAGLDIVLSLRPSYPQALVARARVLLARGDAARALAHLQQADAQSPTTETAWLLADVYDALERAADADAARAQVRARGEREDRRTLALFLAARDEDRELALRLATEEAALRGGIYTDDALAWSLHRLGRHAEAKVASDRALALGTRDASLWFHAGAIALALGERERGRDLLKRALDLNPNFDRTGAREARALLER